jgi:hypothetical protein
MRKLLFAICFAGVAACGGKPSTTTTTPTTTPTTAPAATVLELGEITIFDGDQPMVKIHADGSTELGGHSGSMEIKPGQPASTDSLPVVWKPGPKLGTDGSVSTNGEVRGRVSADGKIVDVKTNQALPMVVSDDKIDITEGGKTVSILLAADGTVSFAGGNASQPDKPPHVQGATTPGKRRTALVLMALLLSGGDAEATPPTTSSPG